MKVTKLICNHGTWHSEKDYILAEYYDDGTEIMFEGEKPVFLRNTMNSFSFVWHQVQVTGAKKTKRLLFYEISDMEKPFTYYLD